MSPARRRQMVDREHPSLSLVRQCALLGCEPFQPLLPSPRLTSQAGPVPDGRDRPAVPGDALLWVETDEGLAGAAGEPPRALASYLNRRRRRRPLEQSR